MSKGTPKEMPLKKYISEVTTELKKVSWPSREDTIQMTILVVGVSTIVALYLGGLDYLFTRLMSVIL